MANDNRLQLTVTDTKFELLDPETLDGAVKAVKSLSGLVDQFVKLKKAFSKGRAPKRDLKKLGVEIDELRKDFETLLGLLTKSFDHQSESVEAMSRLVKALHGRLPKALANINSLAKIVISHDARLKSMEESVEAIKSKSGRKGKSGMK